VSCIWLSPNTTPVDLFVKGYNDQLRRLIAGPYNRGIPVRVKAAGKPVVILGKVIDPPTTPGGKPIERYIPVGEVPWPVGEHSEALLVLAPVSAPGEPLRIIGRSLADDTKSLPPDSIRVVNFTRTNLSSQIGEEVITIDAGAIVTKRYPIASDPSRPVLSNLSIKFAGGDLIYANEVDAWKGSRTIALIHEEIDSGKNKSIQVRLIIDIPWVKAGGAAPSATSK